MKSITTKEQYTSSHEEREREVLFFPVVPGLDFLPPPFPFFLFARAAIFVLRPLFPAREGGKNLRGVGRNAIEISANTPHS